MLNDFKSILMVIIFIVIMLISILIEKKYKLGKIHYHPVIALSIPLLIFSAIMLFTKEKSNMLMSLFGLIIYIMTILIIYFKEKDNLKRNPKYYIKFFFIAPVIAIIYIFTVAYMINI